MDPVGVLAVGAAVAFQVWLFVVVRRTPTRRARQLLRRAKLTPIADVPEGVAVRVVGKVRAIGAVMASPLHGKPCVQYRIVVCSNAPLGLEIDAVEARLPFVLHDETGVATIEPEGAVTVVAADPVQTADLLHLADDPVGRFVAAWRKPTWPQYVYLHESYIEVGSPLAVLGAATREPVEDASTATAGYREEPSTQLRFASSPKFPLRISNEADALDRTSGR